MALPWLPRDGRIVVPTIHRFAPAENKLRVPPVKGERGRHTLQLQNSLLKTIRNNSRFSTAPAGCIALGVPNARAQQQKSPARFARAAWRSFAEYAFLEDSRYASQLKKCGGELSACGRNWRS
jgi:hypothetical protein